MSQPEAMAQLDGGSQPESPQHVIGDSDLNFLAEVEKLDQVTSGMLQPENEYIVGITNNKATLTLPLLNLEYGLEFSPGA